MTEPYTILNNGWTETLPHGVHLQHFYTTGNQFRIRPWALLIWKISWKSRRSTKMDILFLWKLNSDYGYKRLESSTSLTLF